MKSINWRLAAITVIVGASLFAAVAAWASDTTIRVDTVIRDDVGTIHQVHDPVVLGADGEVCDVVIDPDNNSSIWDNNDFIVRSGSSEVVAFDIERARDVPDTHGTLPLDGPATFWVRLGSRIFSAGVTVRFQCQLPTTTQATTTTEPATTTSSTTSMSSTTTSAPPRTTTSTRITTTTAPVTTTSSSTSTTTSPGTTTSSVITTITTPPLTCVTTYPTTPINCCCCCCFPGAVGDAGSGDQSFPAPAQNPTDGGGEPPWVWPLVALIAGGSVMGAAAIHGRMRR